MRGIMLIALIMVILIASTPFARRIPQCPRLYWQVSTGLSFNGEYHVDSYGGILEDLARGNPAYVFVNKTMIYIVSLRMGDSSYVISYYYWNQYVHPTLYVYNRFEKMFTSSIVMFARGSQSYFPTVDNYMDHTVLFKVYAENSTSSIYLGVALLVYDEPVNATVPRLGFAPCTGNYHLVMILEPAVHNIYPWVDGEVTVVNGTPIPGITRASVTVLGVTNPSSSYHIVFEKINYDYANGVELVFHGNGSFRLSPYHTGDAEKLMPVAVNKLWVYADYAGIDFTKIHYLDGRLNISTLWDVAGVFYPLGEVLDIDRLVENASTIPVSIPHQLVYGNLSYDPLSLVNGAPWRPVDPGKIILPPIVTTDTTPYFLPTAPPTTTSATGTGSSTTWTGTPQSPTTAPGTGSGGSANGSGGMDVWVIVVAVVAGFAGGLIPALIVLKRRA